MLENYDEFYKHILEVMHKEGVIQYYGQQDNVRESHKSFHCLW